MDKTAKEKYFIALIPASWGNYILDVCHEEDIAGYTGAICIMETDSSCSGYEIISMCYGLNDGFISEYIGNLPVFVLPFKEEKEPELYL